jgi:hypothetical protein
VHGGRCVHGFCDNVVVAVTRDTLDHPA